LARAQEAVAWQQERGCGQQLMAVHMKLVEVVVCEKLAAVVVRTKPVAVA
jgi:hypothetical protein